MERISIDKIKDYLNLRENVVVAYIFGSFSTDRVGPESDIDIALLLRDSVDSKEYGHIKLTITNDLIDILSFERVDVAILNIASPLFSYEVIKKGVLLFSRDETKRIEYTANAIMRYLDTIYLRSVQDRILHEKIRSRNFGYFNGSYKYSIEKVRKGAPDTSAVK